METGYTAHWNGDIGAKTLISGLRTKTSYTRNGGARTLKLTFELYTCHFSVLVIDFCSCSWVFKVQMVRYSVDKVGN